MMAEKNFLILSLAACTPFILYMLLNLRGLYDIQTQDTIHISSHVVLEEDSLLEHLRLSQGGVSPSSIVHEQNKSLTIDIFSSTSNLESEMDSRKFAIISSSINEAGNRYKYAFSVPLTVLAWKRIGFGVIVILAGAKENWTSDKSASVMYQAVLNLGAKVVFVNVTSKERTMYSQVSRIFQPGILGMQGILDKDDYVITSDADLWPISSKMYDLPAGYDILSLNSFCCQPFTHENRKYRMLPLANIGMKVKTWRQVFEGYLKNKTHPSDPAEMKNYLRDLFGHVVDQRVIKGENIGWYLDQRTISLVISKAETDAHLKVTYKRRNTFQDRIDRIRWNPMDISHKNDAHIVENAHHPKQWAKLLPLINQMFTNEEILWCKDYHDEFMKTLTH